MNGFFWVVGAATVLFVGVLTYAITRRYGWGAAVILPIAALAAMIGMNWQEQGLGFEDGLGLARDTVVFAAPVLGGAVLGIAMAWRRRA